MFFIFFISIVTTHLPFFVLFRPKLRHFPEGIPLADGYFPTHFPGVDPEVSGSGYSNLTPSEFYLTDKYLILMAKINNLKHPSTLLRVTVRLSEVEVCLLLSK
jgi:hypothetical protein